MILLQKNSQQYQVLFAETHLELILINFHLVNIMHQTFTLLAKHVSFLI